MLSPACSISIPDDQLHQTVEGTGDTFLSLPSGSGIEPFAWNKSLLSVNIRVSGHISDTHSTNLSCELNDAFMITAVNQFKTNKHLSACNAVSGTRAVTEVSEHHHVHLIQ